MPVAILPILATWQNFYVIVGTAAATLTGLMFVVITLVAGARMQGRGEGVAAFGTPTVVHFCVALLIAAVLSAPWQAMWNAALLLCLIGLGGVTYIVIVVRRMLRQNTYQPVLEDWLWHTIIPFASYIALIIAAVVLMINSAPSLFIIGAVTLVLLFAGIHNSWDTVTYVTIEQIGQENRDQDESSSSTDS